MSETQEPLFPIFDEPMLPSTSMSYNLPLEQWNWAVRFVERLNRLEGEMMLRARIEAHRREGGDVSAAQEDRLLKQMLKQDRSGS